MDFQEVLALHRAGDIAAAEQAYREILAATEHPDALCNLGLILKDRGEFAEASALLDRAHRAAPDKPIIAYNLGSLRWRLGDLAAALPLLEFAAAAPNLAGARVNLANVYLALGRDREGWPLYDEREERLKTQAHKLNFPEWRGEDLTGKRLFIWSEQGFGDHIFAARFLPHLKGEVTFACPAELTRLFAQLPIRIVPKAAEVVVGDHDFWILPMSLPRWVEKVPAAPYLAAAPRPGGRIGVAWRGNALPDPRRSLSPEFAKTLLALPGAISLDPKDTGARDFQDTAEIIAGLDGVISIDTSVAHLAGALGKRTLVLLPHHSVDWRWREAEPWYSSIAVVRQSAPGDWQSTLPAVKTFLDVAPGRDLRTGVSRGGGST